jgi:hypothetical protein
MLGETDATLQDADACVVAFLDFHQTTHRTQCHSRRGDAIVVWPFTPRLV